MRGEIRCLLDGAPHAISGISPTTTVLEYLREHLHLCGSKEGCAEGDCGACTVVIGAADGDTVRYRAVNACIMFIGALDGRQLLSVEHLRGADGALHPVQQAMLDHHATQCGFCTPGFVMSLFAMQHDATPPTRAAICEGLAGNLCRCTGYRPIIDAASTVCGTPVQDRFVHAAPDIAARLRALDTAAPLRYAHAGQLYLAPRDLDELAAALAAHPDAIILAGGTDVGLYVTKQHRHLGTIVALEDVAGLAEIARSGDTLSIGAGATYEAALPVLAAHFPSFAEMVRRIGARQVRQRGTIGGNIANASPIGDTPPALLALDARLVLRRGDSLRRVALEDFFLAYRRTALAPGEFIQAIEIDLPPPGDILRVWKVSKRLEEDISAVCVGLRLRLVAGRVDDIRIAFGGMAATPLRARAAEAALLGVAWDAAGVAAAITALEGELAPITDMRASAAYRLKVAGNLLKRLLAETTGDAARTRLEVAA